MPVQNNRTAGTVDAALRADAPALTQSRVTAQLRGGAPVGAYADRARGYPGRPATNQQLGDKFRACAARVMDGRRLEAASDMLQQLEQLTGTRGLTKCLSDNEQISSHEKELQR